ncbi:cysteine proteinase [Westerdykella ornata]|uniref:Cysteine proteinase n=1 Tax=Westerdykella ornata TaxID=318751 RepID=A0A6A6JAH1_WESOR|nr:cysteine proteinase [Westerdykella ornata]KAF2272968.1 cysteine proteinase [Westerdykella ornata]
MAAAMTSTGNPMDQYVLNWRPSPLEDKLGVPKFALKTDFDSTTLPPSKDLSGYDTPVKDQGRLGACTAFAAIAIVEHIANRNGRASDWSELYLYYNTRAKVSGWNPNEDTATAYVRGSINQVLKTAFVPSTVDAIRASIASGRPVDIGFVCYSDFTQDSAVYRSGQVPMPTASSYRTGGHSVAIVAYHDGTRQFKFKNSWTTSFGERGYGFLPYDYVTGYTPDRPRSKLVSDCWTIVSIEYESDYVILSDQNAPEGVEHFDMGIINPALAGSDD